MIKIIIDSHTAHLEQTASGIFKLSVPSTGLFITEKAASLHETDLKTTENKIIKRAKSLLWNFPVKTKYDV